MACCIILVSRYMSYDTIYALGKVLFFFACAVLEVSEVLEVGGLGFRAVLQHVKIEIVSHRFTAWRPLFIKIPRLHNTLKVSMNLKAYLLSSNPSADHVVR